MLGRILSQFQSVVRAVCRLLPLLAHPGPSPPPATQRSAPSLTLRAGNRRCLRQTCSCVSTSSSSTAGQTAALHTGGSQAYRPRREPGA